MGKKRRGMMKILKIQILIDTGTDTIFVETDLREACWPWTGPLTLTFHAANGKGPSYVTENFPEVSDVEVINLNLPGVIEFN